MGYAPPLNPFQKYVPLASPPNTRRVCDSLTTATAGVFTTTFADVVQRQGKTLAQTPTRFRFRIRNSNVLANTNPAFTCNVAGIAIGTPSIPGAGPWAGAFTGAPTTVYAGASGVDVGTTELVTPWVTNAGLISAKVPFGISLGINTATPAALSNQPNHPSMGWTATSGTAQSAQFASTGAPTGGSPALGYSFLDVRMEYEFVGSNPIGLYLGTSITVGDIAGPGLGQVFGTVGMDNAWPNMVGLRVGHGISNGGVDGAILSTFSAGVSSNAWSRLLDPTYPTLVWPGGCTPDYLVLDLGVNDLLALATAPLATVQAAFATIIATANTLGIYNIYVNTVPPTTMDLHTLSLYSDNSGLISVALATGANTTVNMSNPLGTSATAPAVGPYGGYPGPAAAWSSYPFWLGNPVMGNLEGPFPNTSAAYTSAVLRLTSPSFTTTKAHPVSDVVLSAAEGYRQLINQWIRSGVTGTSGTIDFSTVSTQQIGLTEQLNPKYFGLTNSGPHPNDPGMYEAWAQLFNISLVGL